MAHLTPPPPAVELTLAIAMVASAGTPLLLLDGKLDVVAASLAFCRQFELDPDDVTGRVMFSLGTGEWDSPRLRSLLTAVASGGAKIENYELDLRTRNRGVRCLCINAHRLDYDDHEAVRLFVAILDVTDARASDRLRDELVRDKSVMLQELQHRIANSLQIIASVLMQSARKTQSEELRDHLTNAHNRVMSVAELQRQLAVSSLADVAMKPYLGQLCQSIGASMIADHDQLSIAVDVDDSSAGPNASVSIGLIVTELVINALKHAFPDHRHGEIQVGYSDSATGWKLTVDDDGVGMPGDMPDAKAGLGTTIVNALAKQLHATVRVAPGRPGTSIIVNETKLRLVDGIADEPEVQAV
ncbi:PAS domain-containing protein [Sphingosinicellaceae bacterium]|nr:PAS domain-containing protein [Sphingosinicellaceae bacterium]